MNAVAALARSTGARKLRDLALASAIEIEKAEEGSRDFERAPIVDLANALVKVSRPTVISGQHRFLAPGYYAPLRRLASKTVENAQALDTVQTFATRLAKELKEFASTAAIDPVAADRLIDYCLALHSELIGETSVRESRRRTRREPSSTGFRPA